MSIPVPLQVRLSTSRGQRDITHLIHDLQFRSVIPGGYASLSIELDNPITFTPDEIAYFGHVYVNDGRSAKRVWEGYLSDPGRGADDRGQVYSLSALGPSEHVHDQSLPLIYVDRSQEHFRRIDNTKPGMETTVGVIPFNEPQVGVVLRSPQGITTTVGDSAGMRYPDVWYSAMKLARVDYDVNSGGPNANWFLKSRYTTDGALSGDIGDSISMTAAGGGASRNAIVSVDFTFGRNTLDLIFIQDTGGTVTAANDLHWAAFINVAIRTVLYDQTGIEITTAPTVSYVFAHEIVADLLGRLLNLYDGANAVLATNTYHIDKLAYPDGVDSGKVLDDLMALEPCYWAAWESNTAGKHRFEWTVWPTSIRYQASTVDGYSSTASADEVYNQVRIRYVNDQDLANWGLRTLAVPELTAAGRIRMPIIDMGTEVNTLANANQAGDLFLTDHNVPLNAGQLSVSRPIYDRVAQRAVQPYEIKPGFLIRVRGIQARKDTLNATTRNGTTVFRVIGVTYQASTNTAMLELDAFPPSVARALAALQVQVTPTKKKRRH